MMILGVTSGGRTKVKGALSEADTIYQAAATDDTSNHIWLG